MCCEPWHQHSMQVERHTEMGGWLILETIWKGEADCYIGNECLCLFYNYDDCTHTRCPEDTAGSQCQFYNGPITNFKIKPPGTTRIYLC